MRFSSVLFSVVLNHITQQVLALDPTDSIMHGGEFSKMWAKMFSELTCSR
jgi:hypothetical protein